MPQILWFNIFTTCIRKLAPRYSRKYHV